MKTLSKILCLALCLCCLFSFAACDQLEGILGLLGTLSGSGDGGSGGGEGGGSVGIEVTEQQWAEMIAEDNFVNYTIDFDGDMTVYMDDVLQAAEKTSSTYRVTADAVQMVLHFPDSEDLVMTMTGDDATIQKTQISQIFLALLAEYDNFTYDSESKAYKVGEVSFTTDIYAIVDGSTAATPIPTTFDIENGTVTISEDGKLLSFTCNYTQTMDMTFRVIKTTGKTTWTFSNYGTTTIEAE